MPMSLLIPEEPRMMACPCKLNSKKSSTARFTETSMGKKRMEKSA